MKTTSKVALLFISIFCLSSCIGGPEAKVDAENNIRWFSEDGKFKFSLEYDQEEDSENGFKFYSGRGHLNVDGNKLTFMTFLSLSQHHDFYVLPYSDAPDKVSENDFGTIVFPIHLDIDFVHGFLGFSVPDITKLEAKTDYNHSDISYFDDFDQKISWERLEEDEKNPLNYFMRTWENEDLDLTFTQDSPKLFIEQKIRGKLSDDSPVLLSFGEEDFSICRYEDAVEGGLLLEGTYTKAVSSISLNVVTNNLYPENPGIIVLE